MWIGGYWNENGWHWSDGTPWHYRSWIPGEPNNPNQKCVTIFLRNNTRWDDESCRWSRSFFCQLGELIENNFCRHKTELFFQLVPDLQCPPGWFPYADSCYQISLNKLSWERARTACESLEVKISFKYRSFYIKKRSF